MERMSVLIMNSKLKYEKLIQICPLWLCPFNLPSQSGLVRNRTGRNRLYVDVGIYGNCSLPGYHPVETTRALEAFTRDAQGFDFSNFFNF